MLRTPLVLLLAASLGAAPVAAQKSWVEKPITASDSLLLLLSLAESGVQQGNLDGSKAALLACIGPIRTSLPRAHLPATRKQLMRFEKVAPLAYKGHQYAGDLAAFQALMAEHLPKLEAQAELIALPPAGPSFHAPGKTFKDQAARVLASFSLAKGAIEAAKAYASAAPAPAVHLQQAESAKITEALRKISLTALSYADHLETVKAGCLKRGQEAATKLAAALKAEKPLIATDHARSLQRWGGYLVRADAASAEGKAFEDQAKKAFQDIEALYEKRIAENRMPETKYTGDDKAALLAEVKKIAATHFPKLTVLRVTLPSRGFFDEWRWAKLADGTWTWRWFSNLKFARVAVGKPGEEKCTVLPMRAERAYKGGAHRSGGLSDLYLVQPDFMSGFTMLQANLPAE